MTSRPERYGRAGKVPRTLHYRSSGGGRALVATAGVGGGRKHRAGRVLAHGMRHVVIALGAPVRFVAGHVPFRRSSSGRRPDGGDGWGSQSSGDREPRRPKPGPPTDSIALPVPRG